MKDYADLKIFKDQLMKDNADLKISNYQLDQEVTRLAS